MKQRGKGHSNILGQEDFYRLEGASELNLKLNKFLKTKLQFDYRYFSKPGTFKMASTSAADAATASGSSENGSKTSDPGGGNNCSIGLNLRVTGYCNQGGRKYMEDVFSVAYQQVLLKCITIFL